MSDTIASNVFDVFTPIDWTKFSVPPQFASEMNRICKAILDNSDTDYQLRYARLKDLSVNLTSQVKSLDSEAAIPYIQKGTFTPIIDWGSDNHRSTGEGTYIKIGPVQLSKFHIIVNEGELPTTSGESGIIRLFGLPVSANIVSGTAATQLTGTAFMTDNLLSTSGYAYHILQCEGASYAFLLACPGFNEVVVTGQVRPVTGVLDPLGSITSITGYTITYT